MDTNVLVAALKSSRGTSFRLLSMVGDKRITFNVSTPLVVEYEAILLREIVSMAPEDIESVIDYLSFISERHEIFYLWRPLLRDPKDDHILELAVKAEAIIVTWNLKDFVPASTFGIEVMTPRDFLIRLEK